MEKFGRGLRARARRMRGERKQGMVLVLVLCVMALLFAFGASVLAAGVSNYGAATRAAAQEQARFGALSFAEWVEMQIQTPGSELEYQVNQSPEATRDDPLVLTIQPTDANNGATDGATLAIWRDMRGDTAGVYAQITNTYRTAEYKARLWFTGSQQVGWSSGGFVYVET